MHNLAVGRIGVAAVLAGMAAAGMAAQSSARVDSKAIDFARLETRLEALRARWNVPGMAAGVASDDEIVWTKGFAAWPT